MPRPALLPLFAVLALLAAAPGDAVARKAKATAKFDGEPKGYSNPDVVPLLVVAVDGKYKPELPSQLWLTPGFHWLQVASAKVGRRGEVTYQPLPINVLACTTYRFHARHLDRKELNSQWEIVYDGKFERKGCEDDGEDVPATDAAPQEVTAPIEPTATVDAAPVEATTADDAVPAPDADADAEVKEPTSDAG
jgi:hypothetical protein